MNIRVVLRFLSVIAYLIGCSMFLCLPWALEVCGGNWEYERRGVFGLLCSILICFLTGLLLKYLAKSPKKQRLFRKEAMAVVGLSWILATILGALPYLISGTFRASDTKMSVPDALFESQSGISTTGATVLAELEKPELVPRCIMFWRSTTQFLGGLGIMVLFVAILGHGSAAKAVMKAEMTAVKGLGQQARIRQTALMVGLVYLVLNAMLILLLLIEGVAPFDAICHAFGTISTGGFSTFDSSVGYFAAETNLNSSLIEWTLIVFMFLGGTNFMLMYWFANGWKYNLFRDTEWKTYTGIIVVATVAIFIVGWLHHDFTNTGTADKPARYIRFTPPVSWLDSSENEKSTHLVSIENTGAVPWYVAVRYCTFHVVSIITTSGFCTSEYEKWNGFARGLTLLLMFIGGCTGSTAGGMKVLRFVIGWKILAHAVEQSFRPNLVRSLKISGQVISKQTIHQVQVYFMMVGALVVAGTLIILVLEPTKRWEQDRIGMEHKLIDVGSSAIATLNNIGPGLGLVGARENYGGFTELSKFLFVWFMMLGRLEMFVILSLFHPAFWKSHS